MQPNKVLSPIHVLATYEPYLEILARTGDQRAMCPMYVLVLEELQRQFRETQEFFVEDNQCLTDSIMAKQAKEQEDLHFEYANATEKNSGYEAGRLARSEALQSMKEIREQRSAERIEKALAERALNQGIER